MSPGRAVWRYLIGAALLTALAVTLDSAAIGAAIAGASPGWLIAGAWLFAKPEPPGQEVLVGELEGGDHQPRHVDL